MDNSLASAEKQTTFPQTSSPQPITTQLVYPGSVLKYTIL